MCSLDLFTLYSNCSVRFPVSDEATSPKCKYSVFLNMGLFEDIKRIRAQLKQAFTKHDKILYVPAASRV